MADSALLAQMQQIIAAALDDDLLEVTRLLALWSNRDLLRLFVVTAQLNERCARESGRRTEGIAREIGAQPEGSEPPPLW
jgi:hypothetical protein